MATVDFRLIPTVRPEVGVGSRGKRGCRRCARRPARGEPRLWAVAAGAAIRRPRPPASRVGGPRGPAQGVGAGRTAPGPWPAARWRRAVLRCIPARSAAWPMPWPASISIHSPRICRSPAFTVSLYQTAKRSTLVAPPDVDSLPSGCTDLVVVGPHGTPEPMHRSNCRGANCRVAANSSASCALGNAPLSTSSRTPSDGSHELAERCEGEPFTEMRGMRAPGGIGRGPR